MNMKNWVHLNDKGKELYGEIFPDGIVPVRSFIPQQARLGAERQVKRIFLVNVDEITEDQFNAIVDSVVKRMRVPRSAVERDFKANGIPLRAELTSGSGTTQQGFFI